MMEVMPCVKKVSPPSPAQANMTNSFVAYIVTQPSMHNGKPRLIEALHLREPGNTSLNQKLTASGALAGSFPFAAPLMGAVFLDFLAGPRSTLWVDLSAWLFGSGLEVARAQEPWLRVLRAGPACKKRISGKSRDLEGIPGALGGRFEFRNEKVFSRMNKGNIRRGTCYQRDPSLSISCLSHASTCKLRQHS